MESLYTLNKLRIIDNCHIEIEYNNKKILYKNFSDLSFNKGKNEFDDFLILEHSDELLESKDFSILKNFFCISYDKKFFESKMKGKMNFLKIEGNLTLYAIYENKVSII